ncbi:MAG TPA: STAS domain-containing protein, partial [Kofleriaceae bacterium]
LTPLTQIPGPLVIDLGGLERINSLGVRDWMHFVRTCEAAGTALTFERCSPTIVGQMSMITGFMGASHISSIEVPYVCTSCNHEQLQLLDLDAGGELQLAIECPKCRAPTQLDDFAEIYSEVVRLARR